MDAKKAKFREADQTVKHGRGDFWFPDMNSALRHLILEHLTKTLKSSFVSPFLSFFVTH